MIILGIDPGTATTGFGLIKQTQQNRNHSYEILEFGVITTPTTMQNSERLNILYQDVQEIIKKHKPDKAGIEKLFFTNNQKTAIAVAEARGVVLLALRQANIQIEEFTPLQVKSYLTGYGKADKKQVQNAIQHIFKLAHLPKPDDAADALAIALCASYKK